MFTITNLSPFTRNITLISKRLILLPSAARFFSDDSLCIEKLLDSPKDIASISLLFDQISAVSSRQWDAIIRDISASSQPQKSVLLYIIMRRKGAIPTKHTFPSLLKSFFKSQNQNPFHLLPHIVKFGFNSDPFVRNSLISALFSSGHLELARQVFDESQQVDVVSWTALINGYLKTGCFVEGLKCFKEMRLNDIKVDGMTIVTVLTAAGKMGNIWFGRSIHGFYMVTGRVKWDVFIGSAIVDMYSKCGRSDDARKYFDEMPSKNVVSWSALISGYVQCNRFREALDIFQDMLTANVRPSEFTFTSVLAACAEIGALVQGIWIHNYIERCKLEMNSMVGAALINMYTKCGCLDEAFMVYRKLSGNNVYTWNAMINGLAMHGSAIGSLNLFLEMLRSGIYPNEVSFLSVLSACSHGGLVDEGRKLFAMMQGYGLTPSVDHYSCMVDLLGRAGYLEEARKLIEDMPMEPTAGVWGALFGACMIHKAFDLGEYVGKHLIKLQPHHSGRYALLANLYSRCQQWDSAAQIRKLMKEKGVKKTPGCSWIEVNGTIHEFIAFDRSHFECYSLNQMMDSFIIQLTLADYASDCSLFAFDFELE
ncbi:hypothetical protein COLO4_16615 [Corchorus olitorius]|uniref:Pentatricopeptide repeat-containing protein n=1 Tax=Corchorus olitorius TaxID=93759 RepID=A0A1R3JGI3_9ROSI|nr:hypothetical protein COLO4_16615 [Corchorus olitorius]